MHHFKLFFAFQLFLFALCSGYAKKKNLSTTEVISFDHFDHKSKNLVQANWFTYNDSIHAGKSNGANRIIKDPANQNQYMQFTYKLDQAKCVWAPYAALSSAITSDVFPPGIQAISYRFKGDGHMLVVKTATIKDYCYYNIHIPASSVWTTVTVPISELKQPAWGKQMPLDIHAFEGLSWQVTGKTNDAGMVSVDDINLLYTPQHAINPLPATQRGLQIDSIHTIHSTILNEDRRIYVYLPPSYNAFSMKKYPVVYLLDGDNHIEYIGGLIETLSPVNHNTAFPEMIVVGIVNTNRIRDLSPTHIPSDPFDATSRRFDASGGNAAFMSFIEKELMPMIEKTYSPANYKTFVGHSLGGLTVLNTLIHKPHLFDAYLALDPSLWWDDQLLLKQADAVFGKINLPNKKLYIAIANTMYKGVDTAHVKEDASAFSFQLRANLNFIDLLKKYPASGLTWKYAYYPDEDHISVTDAGELDGMKFLFERSKSDINKHFTFTATPFGRGFEVSNTLAPSSMGYTVYPPEKFINEYGYDYLAKKNYLVALSLFQFNSANYPLSPFVFDALGDYYVATNDIENARKNYSQALTLSSGRLAETKRKLEKLN